MVTSTDYYTISTASSSGSTTTTTSGTWTDASSSSFQYIGATERDIKARPIHTPRERIPRGVVHPRRAKNTRKNTIRAINRSGGWTKSNLWFKQRLDSSQLLVQLNSYRIRVVGFAENDKPITYDDQIIHDTFYFDKEGNHIQMNHRDSYEASTYGPGKGNQPKDGYTRVSSNHVHRRTVSNEMEFGREGSYLIIDKKRFIDSRGSKFQVLYKNVNYNQFKIIRKKTMKAFANYQEDIDRLKGVIGNVYDQENYDILYGISFNKKTYFFNTLRFPDVTIRNSIENEHHIGEILTSMTGYFMREDSTKPKLYIRPSLRGLRVEHTPYDVKMGYTHSHLPSSGRSNSFQEFCLGSIDHPFVSVRDDYVSDLEFEGVLLAIDSFVHWESLEGGPHYKMENITRLQGQVLPNSTIGKNVRGDGHIADFMETFEEKANKLSPAFTIIKDTKGYLRFVVDKNLFHKLFQETYSKDMSKILKKYTDLIPYYYSGGTGEYYSSDGSIGRWKLVVRDARLKLASGTPVYMNGKFIRPKLVKIDTPPDFYIEHKETFNPDIVENLGETILYRLQNELLNYKE